jgi:hypothetical protein
MRRKEKKKFQLIRRIDLVDRAWVPNNILKQKTLITAGSYLMLRWTPFRSNPALAKPLP